MEPGRPGLHHARPQLTALHPVSSARSCEVRPGPRVPPPAPILSTPTACSAPTSSSTGPLRCSVYLLAAHPGQVRPAPGLLGHPAPQRPLPSAQGGVSSSHSRRAPACSRGRAPGPDGGPGLRAPPAPGPGGPGCPEPCENCWAPGLSVTARPPWASPCCELSLVRVQRRCSPSPGPRLRLVEGSWGTSTPTGAERRHCRPTRPGVLCRAPW